MSFFAGLDINNWVYFFGIVACWVAGAAFFLAFMHGAKKLAQDENFPYVWLANDVD